MNNDTIKKQTYEPSNKKPAESVYNSKESYDIIVIGGGLCGIIFLAQAHKKGLRCIILEKQNDVGGLWNRIPSWQDIQNRRQDISIDDVRLDGIDQPAMHRYAHEWVRRYELDPYIRLGCEVTDVSQIDEGWMVRTKQGKELHANNLIVASGVQNEPRIPDLDRSDSKIEEVHSFNLRKPESLSNQRVSVVGGGASSQDLLDLAFKHGAKEIHWIYREKVKWFIPTRRVKQRAWPNLRELAFAQFINGTGTASAFMRWLLRLRYNRLGISELVPKEPFDFDKHQLIPGRYSVIRNLGRIYRHQAQVRSFRNKTLTLSNGEHFETDKVLWGTGYNTNLRYLNLPEYNKIKKLSELHPKLGSLVKSLDYPNLFFLGITLINTTLSTPLSAAIESKTIISHILGECEIPDKILTYRLTHWDLIRYFATFDRDNYPKWWRFKYLWLSFWYLILQNRSVRVGVM